MNLVLRMGREVSLAVVLNLETVMRVVLNETYEHKKKNGDDEKMMNGSEEEVVLIIMQWSCGVESGDERDKPTPKSKKGDEKKVMNISSRGGTEEEVVLIILQWCCGVESGDDWW